MRNPILLTLTLTTLLLSLPASAADRGAPQRGLHLEPDPDGTYALPLLEKGHPVPLEFDPGEARIRLEALSFEPERAILHADLRNLGEHPISAWSVEVTSFSGGGDPLGSARRTQDWATTVPADAIRRPRAHRLSTAVHEDGLFLPGQIHRIELGVTVSAQEASPTLGRVVLSVPVVVFGDTSFSGSARLAREILGARKAAAEELAYWSVRLREVAQEAGSPQEAHDALLALRLELEEEPEGLPFSAQAVRSNLVRNIDPIVRRIEERPDSAGAELRDLSEWLGSELEDRSRHVPRELPKAPEPPVAGDAIDERLGEGFETGDEEPNCECGGSIFASVSQNQSRNCDGTATGWRVDEIWDYTCLSEDGVALGSGSRSLNGQGGCIEDVPCYPDVYCPPKFSVPTVTQQGDFHVWNRTVLNYKLAVGVCTARCITDTSESLTIQCGCMPKPDPTCDTDGCPVLIETGAGGFTLTDLDGGVAFDIDADGEPEQVAWPITGTDDAWLALDRDGNGSIDDGTELFGDATPQPASSERNGFLALAEFDRPENGGNGDGQISASDAVFPDLLLWLDRNHDGLSEPSELSGLEAAGIVAIELDYHESRRRDRFGNQIRYSAGVWYASGARRLAVDVFLLHE